MTDFQEIERMRKDPQQALNLAKRLLSLADQDWRPNELDFLKDMLERHAPRAINGRPGAARGAWSQAPLSTRQIEWLIDLRDSIGEHSVTPNGFSVAKLIENCWLNRLDLDDDDQADFLNRVRGRTTLKKRQLGLLLHLARKLHEIEEYV